LGAASRQGRRWAGEEEGKGEGKGKGRKGEVEGREREGPQVTVEPGPSEPCYATDDTVPHGLPLSTTLCILYSAN